MFDRKQLYGRVIDVNVKVLLSPDDEQANAVLELLYDDGRLVTLHAYDPVSERYYVEFDIMTDEERKNLKTRGTRYVMKTETYIQIDSYELEQLIEQHLGIAKDRWDFSVSPGVHYPGWGGFVSDMECSNDSQHTFGLGSEKYGWKWSIEQYEASKEENDAEATNYSRPEYYIAKLIEKGVIPEGNVLVEVSW